MYVTEHVHTSSFILSWPQPQDGGQEAERCAAAQGPRLLRGRAGSEPRPRAGETVLCALQDTAPCNASVLRSLWLLNKYLFSLPSQARPGPVPATGHLGGGGMAVMVPVAGDWAPTRRAGRGWGGVAGTRSQGTA